jgi:hypothetical protein
MHNLVRLHDTVGSVRPQRDIQAVQYSLILMWAAAARQNSGKTSALNLEQQQQEPTTALLGPLVIVLQLFRTLPTMSDEHARPKQHFDTLNKGHACESTHVIRANSTPSLQGPCCVQVSAITLLYFNCIKYTACKAFNYSHDPRTMYILFHANYLAGHKLHPTQPHTITIALT